MYFVVIIYKLEIKNIFICKIATNLCVFTDIYLVNQIFEKAIALCKAIAYKKN